MEQLAELDSEKILMIAGTVIGMLVVTNIGALGTGLVFLLRQAYKHGQEAGLTEAYRVTTDKSLKAAHDKIRELSDGFE